MLDLYLNSSDCNYQIIGFPETWFKPHIFDYEILNRKFQIFRYDDLKRIGGVFLLPVHYSIRSEDVPFMVFEF